GRDLDRHHPWSILLAWRLRHGAVERPIAICGSAVRCQHECSSHPQPKSPSLHWYLSPASLTGASLWFLQPRITFFLCSFLLILAYLETPRTFPFKLSLRH